MQQVFGNFWTVKFQQAGAFVAQKRFDFSDRKSVHDFTSTIILFKEQLCFLLDQIPYSVEYIMRTVSKIV